MQLARAVLITLTLSLACTKEGGEAPTNDAKPTASEPAASAGINLSKLESGSAIAMKVAMAQPNVAAAMTKAWEDIATDPQVAAAGEALMAEIGEHEVFAPAAADFLAKLQTSPGFIGLVTQFVTSSGALTDPAGVEAAFGRHVDAQIARPEFSQALDASIARLMAKPEVEAAIARFVNVIVEDSGVALQASTLIAAKINSPEILDKLHKNAGTSPSDPDYEQKVLAYLTDEARLERFLIGFAEMFAKHQAPRDAVVELLRSKAVIGETAGLVAKMISLPDFYPLAEAALVAALDGSDRATLEIRIDAVLQHPQVVTALADWMIGIAAVPEVQQGCSSAFQKLFMDPQFELLLMKTFVE